MELNEIGEEIKTQDNMATENPIFILFDQIRYPAKDGYGDECVYVDQSSDAYEIENTKEALVEFYKDDSWFPETAEKLTKEELFEEIKKHRDIELFDVYLRKEFKQAFFTKKSAEQYLKSNRHHFKNPLIWCDTLWRNYEMQSVRNALIKGDLT